MIKLSFFSIIISLFFHRFFPNEVMRVPLYEVVPVELIMSLCWVLDLNTYCKGRPIGADEEHIYICEYRVDKSARLFSKISKSKYPVCTKTYAFERFDQKLKLTRTYTPHELDQAVQMKPRGRKPVENEENHKEHAPSTPIPELPVIRVRVSFTIVESRNKEKYILEWCY